MAAAYENLRVYRSAMALVVYFEKIIVGFRRAHKYTLGSEIRELSYAALFTVVEANEREFRVQNLKEALKLLLKIKLRVQVCAELRIFHQTNSFSTALKMIVDVEKQCEGWLRSCGNPGRPESSRERAGVKSLGAPAANSSGIRKQGMVPQGSVPVGRQRHQVQG